MTAGELFLGSLSSGVITQAERAEQAAMQRQGHLLDQGFALLLPDTSHLC